MAALVAYFYDIENCDVPANRTANDVVCGLQTRFSKYGQADLFYVACKNTYSGINLTDFSKVSCLLRLDRVPTSDNKQVDRQIIRSMDNLSNVENESGKQKVFVLISGDKDLAEKVYQLKAKGHKVFVVLPPSASNNKLAAAATEVYLFDATLEFPVLNDSTGRLPFAEVDTLVGYFYDIANCDVPAKKTANDVVVGLQKRFSHLGTEDMFYVARNVSYTGHFEPRITSKFEHIDKILENSHKAVSDKMMSVMRDWSSKETGKGKKKVFVLITGSGDFAKIVYGLRIKEPVNHIFYVVCPVGRSKVELRETANGAFVFDETLNFPSWEQLAYTA